MPLPKVIDLLRAGQSVSEVFSDFTRNGIPQGLTFETPSVAASVDRYINALQSTGNNLHWPSDLPPFHLVMDIFEYNSVFNTDRSGGLSPPLAGYDETKRQVRIKLPMPEKSDDNYSISWVSEDLFDFWDINATKDLRGMTSLITGSTINRALALLFNGPELKSYIITWVFVPRNLQESETIRRIIGWIKWGMHTERNLGGTVFKYPSIFRLQYSENITESARNVGNDIGNSPRAPDGKGQRWLSTSKWQPFKPAVVQKLAVNFAPDGHPILLENGYSEAIKITMQFKEIEYFLKDDFLAERDGNWPGGPGRGNDPVTPGNEGMF